MKTKFLAVALLLAASAVFAEVPVVDQVIVRQQWPWSRNVVIEYKLTGGSDAVDIAASAWNGSQAVDSVKFRAALKGDIYNVSGTEGVHRIEFDPVDVFGDSYNALSEFKVELTAAAGSQYNPDEVIYKIVDLVGGAIEDVTRADILNGRKGSFVTSYAQIDPAFTTPEENVLIWTGVTNDAAYATTKLVLRKISKGSFMMGSPADEAGRDDSGTRELQHSVTLTKDFWIGVFPVTQKQHELLGGANNSYFTNATYSAMRPVDNLSVKADLRGQTVVADIDAVTVQSSATVFPVLRERTGNVASFDLPTEAQWEYACRALSTGPIYTGEEFTENAIAKIGRTGLTGGGENLDRNAAADIGTARVGSYKPNAWGLYDMIGNVSELCRDNYSGLSPNKYPQTVDGALIAEDPINREASGTSTSNPVRGFHANSSFTSSANYRIAKRQFVYYIPDGTLYGIGYRISFTEN